MPTRTPDHEAETLGRLRAVDALVAGAALPDAAAAAGVEVETLRAWSRDDAPFIARLNRAKVEQAERLRAEVRALAAQAAATLRELLTTPDAPPAVRLRAALAVLGGIDALAPEKIGPQSANGVEAALVNRDLLDSLGG
jgi:hypothetical protein